MHTRDVREVFERFARHTSAPQTELQYSTPYELLVAVMLSAQATDVGVNKATQRLFPIANTPERILALGETSLLELLNTLNLYKTKTRHLLRLSQQLLDHHQGQVPETREALEALPGVGRKTANVILNVLYGVPCIAVDTHIFRVAQRIGLAEGNTPLDIEQGLMKVIPEEFLQNAHHWLVLHGRYVCKARKPECHSCLLADLCQYPLKDGKNQS